MQFLYYNKSKAQIARGIFLKKMLPVTLPVRASELEDLY